jgi:hypothetical protein
MQQNLCVGQESTDNSYVLLLLLLLRIGAP